MSESERHRPRPDDWPAEEGGGAGQEGLRSDIGASLQRPRAEDEPDEERVEPTGQRGSGGSGQVAGRGKLGTPTPSEEGAAEDPG